MYFRCEQSKRERLRAERSLQGEFDNRNDSKGTDLKLFSYQGFLFLPSKHGINVTITAYKSKYNS